MQSPTATACFHGAEWVLNDQSRPVAESLLPIDPCFVAMGVVPSAHATWHHVEEDEMLGSSLGPLPRRWPRILCHRARLRYLGPKTRWRPACWPRSRRRGLGGSPSTRTKALNALKPCRVGGGRNWGAAVLAADGVLELRRATDRSGRGPSGAGGTRTAGSAGGASLQARRVGGWSPEAVRGHAGPRPS